MTYADTAAAIESLCRAYAALRDADAPRSMLTPVETAITALLKLLPGRSV